MEGRGGETFIQGQTGAEIQTSSAAADAAENKVKETKDITAISVYGIRCTSSLTHAPRAAPGGTLLAELLRTQRHRARQQHSLPVRFSCLDQRWLIELQPRFSPFSKVQDHRAGEKADCLGSPGPADKEQV